MFERRMRLRHNRKYDGMFSCTLKKYIIRVIMCGRLLTIAACNAWKSCARVFLPFSNRIKSIGVITFTSAECRKRPQYLSWEVSWCKCTLWTHVPLSNIQPFLHRLHFCEIIPALSKLMLEQFLKRFIVRDIRKSFEIYNGNNRVEI